MKNLVLFLGLIVLFSNCRQDPDIVVVEPDPVDTLPPISDTSSILGFSILNELPGIWNGPVTSTTPLGSYMEWIVDFRPNSTAQISAKNELDSLNDVIMSFFVGRFGSDYKIGFRNGGGFGGQTRIAYQFCDSVSISAGESFYRFGDPVAGQKRVRTDITFKDDSLIMRVYTDYYGINPTSTEHMTWRAIIKDTTAADAAQALFNFPQKELVRDMTTDFDGQDDAFFYTGATDPFPESEQPYLGQSQISIDITNPATVDASKKVLIIITTKPLFTGFVFDPSKLDFRSRYVFVGAADPTGYTFNYMHPGDYYVNAIYDENGDFNFSSGDYMNGSFDVPLTLPAMSTASETININFPIP